MLTLVWKGFPVMLLRESWKRSGLRGEHSIPSVFSNTWQFIITMTTTNWGSLGPCQKPPYRNQRLFQCKQSPLPNFNLILPELVWTLWPFLAAAGTVMYRISKEFESPVFDAARQLSLPHTHTLMAVATLQDTTCSSGLVNIHTSGHTAVVSLWKQFDVPYFCSRKCWHKDTRVPHLSHSHPTPTPTTTTTGRRRSKSKK